MNETQNKRRERMRLWQANNREKVRESNRRWAAENPEKCRKRLSRWYGKLSADASQRAARAKKSRQWRAENPDKHRAIQQTRRARKLGARGKYTKADVDRLFAVQDGKCALAWCRKSIKAKHHVDHIMALACGGSNEPSNLQLLCPACNWSKGAKHPVAFAQQNGMLL